MSLDSVAFHFCMFIELVLFVSAGLEGTVSQRLKEKGKSKVDRKKPAQPHQVHQNQAQNQMKNQKREKDQETKGHLEWKGRKLLQ